MCLAKGKDHAQAAIALHYRHQPDQLMSSQANKSQGAPRKTIENLQPSAVAPVGAGCLQPHGAEGAPGSGVIPNRWSPPPGTATLALGTAAGVDTTARLSPATAGTLPPSAGFGGTGQLEGPVSGWEAAADALGSTLGTIDCSPASRNAS